MALVKLKNNALANLTSFEGSASLGDMVFISSATASSSASIEFDLGSYKEYKFFFVNMHPATDNADFQFNFSTDNGSNYNVTKTTTAFEAYQNEAGSSSALTYQAGDDIAQGTGFQDIASDVGNGNDECCSGFLHLFNPSSTTFVKHFIATGNMYNGGDFTVNDYVAGYCNTTTAIDGVQFKMDSGNIDSGTIKLYGIKDS